MGMQALHANPRTTDTAVRTRAGVSQRKECVALGGIAAVGVGDLVGIEFGLGSAHSTRRLEAADGQDLAPADEPVASRHRFAIVEQWSVAQHNRISTDISDHDLEGAAR